MKGNAVVKINDIRNRIHTIRGLQVMLDKDLAMFYDVKPIRLREQVKRNIKRFPSDFMFRLTEEEVETMVSQNAIPSKKNLGGSLPFVFTEQGVAAISAVLTSERAININIQIMRAFVAMRHFIASNAKVFQRLDTIEQKQFDADKKFKQIFDAIDEQQITPKKGVFFEGQIFDAYVLVSKIVKSSKKTIVIIDNYVDDTVLTLLTKRKKNVKVKIYTKTISKQMALDVKKYNSQYPTLEIKEFKNAHDRFLIIDDKDVYHFGASLKDLGKKWFAFSKFDKEAFTLIERLESVLSNE